MTSKILAAFLAFTLAGCLRSTTYSNCQSNADCTRDGVAGRCEVEGLCSTANDSCPSGRSYDPATPGVGGQCVAEFPPDARADGAIDGSIASALNPCVPSVAHADTPGSCAAKVCAKDATCCQTSWTSACVWWAQSLCDDTCATMAFVGGLNPDASNGLAKSAIVIDPADQTVLWSIDEAEHDTHAAGWADFDGDGDADLATAGGNLMRIFRNDGMVNGKLDLQEIKTASWSDLVAGTTFDGRDVKWVQLTPGGPFTVLFLGYGGVVRIDQVGNGFGSASVFIQADPPALWEVSVGDVNGDGYPELATAHWGVAPRFYKNDHGTLVQSAWTGTSASTSAIGIQWCNLDADAAPELVVSNLSNMTIYDVDPTTDEVKPTPSRTFSEGNYRSVRCVDLNNDGFLDLFASFWYTTSPQAFAGDGTLGGLQKQWPPTGVTLQQATQGAWFTDVGDMDHDGKLDVYISGDGYAAMSPTKTMTLVYYHNTSVVGGVINFTEQRLDSAILQFTRNIALAQKPPIAQ
ncbi:MAG: VCBS repeat-containing protein [Deltaproteobacteria bacterium]|nr:VCBS repeat-containing protein [Deltaproteobacteria bacterium]